MASATPHTIVLRGDPIGREALANAASAIKPGMLIEKTSTGTVRPHSVAAGVAAATFATENAIIGKDIDAVYADGDTVQYSEFRKGDCVYAFLQDEGNVAIGAFLESDGAGALKVSTHAITSATTAAAYPVAKAIEAVNNTGGSGPVRIKVEVL